MIRAELDLTRQVEEDISVFPQPLQPFLQPVKVGLQIFHAVQETAIRAQAVLIHHILKGYQRRYVNCAGIRYGLVGGVKVHNGDGAFQSSEELMFSIAVGRFSAPGRAAHDFAKRHAGADDGRGQERA